MLRVGLCKSDVSVRLCICLSVCLSVTAGIVSKRKELASWFLHHLIADGEVWCVKKFARGHPHQGRYMRLGWLRTGDFGDFPTYEPPYLRNGPKRCKIRPRLLLNTNRKQHKRFDWYQRPWMTLNWPWTAIMRFFTVHVKMSFRVHHKIMNEDRPILSVAKM